MQTPFTIDVAIVLFFVSLIWWGGICYNTLRVTKNSVNTLSEQTNISIEKLTCKISDLTHNVNSLAISVATMDVRQKLLEDLALEKKR